MPSADMIIIHVHMFDVSRDALNCVVFVVTCGDVTAPSRSGTGLDAPRVRRRSDISDTQGDKALRTPY